MSDEKLKESIKIDAQRLSIFNTVLASLLTHGKKWSLRGKEIKSMEDYIRLSNDFADESIKHLTQPETLYCSFCGKSQHDVRKLVTGMTGCICDECNSMAADIINEQLEDEKDD